jgi:hypothetical protein
MYLTLDILSDNDPSFTEDKTYEWEKRVEEDSSPKLRFPLKMRDEILMGGLEFKEPIIESPKEKKKKENNEAKVIDMRKSNKNNKNIF